MRGLILAALLPAAAGSAAEAPASPAADPVVATVDGAAIRRSEVLERLWKVHGRAALQEAVDETLVAQAAAKLKITADPREVERRLGRLRSQFRDETSFLASLKEAGSSIDALRRQLGERTVLEALVRKKADLSVSEAELREYFDRNRDALATREQVRLRYLLVKTEAEANSALAAIRAGADFGKLAGELSLDASRLKGGDLGFVGRGTLTPPAETLAFSLKPGETGTIRTPQGWHVIQLVEHRKAEPAEFKKVKDGIRETLRALKLEEATPVVLRKLREEAVIERGTADLP